MDEICTILGPRSIVSNQIQVRSDGVSFLTLPSKSQSGVAITRCMFDDTLPLHHILRIARFSFVYTLRVVFGS